MIENDTIRRQILEQVDRPVPRSKRLLEAVLGKSGGPTRPLRDLLFFDLTATLKVVTKGIETYRARRRRRRVKREAKRARRLLALIGKIHDERLQGDQAHYRQSSAELELETRCFRDTDPVLSYHRRAARMRNGGME